MTRTRKDVVATALVAIVVLAYAGYLAFGSVPFVHDVRGMAAVGLIGGFLSRRIGGREAFAHDKVAMAAGFATMGLGIAALATESGLLLALFIVSTGALWYAATQARDTGVPAAHLRPSR